MNIKSSYSILVIMVWVSLSGACNEKNEEFTGADAVVDIDVPNNCTIPGELELESDTVNILKKYQQSNDDLLPQASPTNPKKYNLD